MVDKSPLVFGVLLADAGVQLLDFAALDIIAIFGIEYLKHVPVPDALKVLGRHIEFRYIVDKIKGEDAPTHIELTGGAKIAVTDTLDTVGKLDYLIIPGPPPSYVPSTETITFIQKQATSTRAVLTVCTGIIPLLYTGLLSGKRVTGPLRMIPLLEKQAPDAEWTIKRWVTDDSGKLWTSGSVSNGLDMMAAFVKTLVPPELANFMLAIADVGDRGQDISESVIAARSKS